MAVTFKGTTATFADRAGNGAMTPALPANATTNDLAFLFAYLDSGTASGPEAAGWNVAAGSPFGGATPKGYLWWKRLGSAEVAPTITVAAASPTTSQGQAGYITFTSDAAVTPVEAFSSGTSGLGTPGRTPAVTALSAGALAVAFIGRGDNEAFASQAIGGVVATERVDKAGAAGDDSQITIFTRVLAAAGSSGTATAVTSATDPFVGIMVALSPRVEVPVTGVRASPNPAAGAAGGVVVAVGGDRASASAVAAAGETVTQGPVIVVGVQATAGSAGVAGSPRVAADAVVAAAVAAGVAGVPVAAATGVAAQAAAAGVLTPGADQLWDVRLTATNADGSDDETKTAYLTVVAAVGSRVTATGVRADATARAQSGQVGGVLLAGARAVATASARPSDFVSSLIGGERAVAYAPPVVTWTVKLTADNANGSDDEIKSAYVQLRPAVGDTWVGVPGTVAAATATAAVGGILSATVTGSTATATAVGSAGDVGLTSTLTGAQAAAVATATAGSIDLNPLLLAGAQAHATAAGRVGAPAVAAPSAGTWRTRTTTGARLTLVGVRTGRTRVNVPEVRTY